MGWKCQLCVLTIAITAALNTPSLSWGEAPSVNDGKVLAKTKAIKQAKSIAKRTSAVLEMAELLDELTKTRGDLVLKAAGRKPIAEKTFFGVEFRVPDVEL